METSMIVNLCILGFVLLTTLIGLIKGLYKSVITVILLAVAIFLGSLAAGPLTPKAVDKLYPKIEGKVIELVEKRAQEESTKADFVTLLENMGLVDLDDLINKITVENKDEFEKGVKDAIYEPVRITLWVIVAIVAFLILSIVGSALGKAIKKSDGLNTINRLLGAALGLATGLFIVWGLSYLTAATGLYETVSKATQQSEVYEFLISTMPENVFGKFQTVTLPILGEIDISEIFKK